VKPIRFSRGACCAWNRPARAGGSIFSNPVHQLLAATAILSGQSLATAGYAPGITDERLGEFHATSTRCCKNRIHSDSFL
jgi:hypothetical protein